MIGAGVGLMHLSWSLLGGGGSPTPEPEAYPTTAASVVNVTPLTYDEWVYDSGAARGLNSAALPVSGTAADNGASIYARAVRADTQEAVSTWQEIGTVAGGTWSGFVACPRSPHSLQIEVAQASEVSAYSAAGKRYVSGHVIHFWGQSWFNGIFNFGVTTLYEDLTDGSFTNATDVYPIADPNAVQVIGVASTASSATTAAAERRFVRIDQPVNTQLVRLANGLAAGAPGERFCLVSQARAGTGISDLMDDSTSPTTTRDWVSDVVPVDTLARTDGAVAGLLIVDWMHNLRSLNEDATEMLRIALFSETLDGTPVVSGPTQTFTTLAGENTYNIHHTIKDLYDYSETAILLSGPHRNEIDEGSVSDAVSAFTRASGDYVPLLAGADQVRDAYDALANDPSLSSFIVGTGLQANHIFARKEDDQHGTPSFGSQGYETEDGDAEYEAYTAYALLEALGKTPAVVTADQPRVASMVYTPTHIEVAFENDAGPVDITTARLLRGDAPIAAPLAHQTEVMGFEVMGRPAHSATIVDGKVHLGPLGGAPFVTLNDCFPQFGRGIGAGQLAKDSDQDEQTWKNLPGWAKPGLLPNDTGARIVPARVPAKAGSFPVTNTLDVAPGTSIRSDASTAFKSPGTLSALIYGKPPGDKNFEVVPEGTVEIVCTLPDNAETAGNFYLYRMGSGSILRFTPWNRRIVTGGTVGFMSTASNAYTPGVEHTFRFSWSVARATSLLQVSDGINTETKSRSYASLVGEQLNNLELLTAGAITGIEFRHFKFWDSSLASGDAPAGNPLIAISGGPEYTSRHPFHFGAPWT